MRMSIFDDKNVREKIAEIAKKHTLKLVVLFGSQATGVIHEKSDIDVALIGNGPIDFNIKLKLADDFSALFQREDVEVVDLETASPTLMHVVVSDGKLLYESESDNFLKWKLYAIRVWMETAWLRNLRNKKLLEWANVQ